MKSLRIALWALVADVATVVVFVAIGRRNHDETTGASVPGRLRVTLYASAIRNRSGISVTQDSPSIAGMPLNAMVRSVQVTPLAQ